MGFTRYYTVTDKLSSERFKEYSKECKYITEKLTEKFGHDIAGSNGEGDPQFCETFIRFNGEGDESCETFSIGVEEIGFNFVKTRGRPYDKHVNCCLILAKKYFKDNIKYEPKYDDIEFLSLMDSLQRDYKINLILK